MLTTGRTRCCRTRPDRRGRSACPVVRVRRAPTRGRISSARNSLPMLSVMSFSTRPPGKYRPGLPGPHRRGRGRHDQMGQRNPVNTLLGRTGGAPPRAAPHPGPSDSGTPPPAAAIPPANRVGETTCRGEVGSARQREHDPVRAHERRAQLKMKTGTSHPDGCLRPIQRGREVEGLRHERRRKCGRAALSRHRDRGNPRVVEITTWMAHSATTRAGSRPLPPENRAISRSASRRFSSSTLVVGALGPGERDGHLRDAVLEVQLQGNQREAFWVVPPMSLRISPFVEQQLARAGGEGCCSCLPDTARCSCPRATPPRCEMGIRSTKLAFPSRSDLTSFP